MGEKGCFPPLQRSQAAGVSHITPTVRAKRMNAHRPAEQLAFSTLAQSGTQAQGMMPVTFRLRLLSDVLIAQTNADIFSLRLSLLR